MRRLALAFVIFGSTACTEPCLQLAYNMCNCQPTTFLQQQCNVNAQNAESRAQPNADQQKVCSSLLSTCDCTQLTTPEGKEACGLAREASDGGTTDGG